MSDVAAAQRVERLPWDEFLTRLAWRQGEHVSLIGPTGGGKTTLALALLPRRQFVIAFGTKPTTPGKQDKTLTTLVKQDGWKLVRTVEQMPDNVQIHRSFRVVFWPKYLTPEDEPRQAYQIGRQMAEAFTEGGWCLYLDELWWLERKLGLTRLVESILTQGRALGISVVVGTQRPAFVSLLIYDQPTHVFFWRDNDERNLKRIAGMNGLHSRLIRETVSSLDKYECLYVNTRTGQMLVTKAPAPGK